MTQKARGIIVALAAAVSFGLYPPCAKLAYADGASIGFVVITTTFARALALALFCALTRKPTFPERQFRLGALRGGFFQAMSIFGIIGSLAYLPGPVTITINFTHTIMLLFFLAYKREIVLTKLAIITTLVALLGVSLVVGVWQSGTELSLIGLALVFMAALATMSRLYVYGKQVQDQHPAVVGAQVFTVSFLFTLPLVFFVAITPPLSLSGYIAVGFCCLSLILGTFGMFFGIALSGSFQFSLMVKLEPMFTAIFSILLLNEILSGSQYLGMILIMGSLIIFQLLSNPKKSKEEVVAG